MTKPVVIRSLPELDALVVEKVMGVVNLDQWQINHRMDGAGHYSTHISAAWEVVEKLKDDWSFHSSKVFDICECCFHWMDNETSPIVHGMAIGENQGSEHIGMMSTAICLAALKTVGVEVQLQLPE